MTHELQNATSHNTWIKQYGSIAFICFAVLFGALGVGYIQNPPLDPQLWQHYLPNNPFLAVTCMTAIGFGAVISFLTYLHCLGALRNEGGFHGLTKIFAYPILPLWTLVLLLAFGKLALFILRLI